MTDTDSLLKLVLVVVLAVVFLPMLVMLPMMGMFGWTHMGGTGMWDGPFSWFVWLMMLVLPLVVLAGVGYVAYRLLTQADGRQTDTAMAELRRAYARGELSDEEFETRRERLRRDE